MDVSHPIDAVLTSTGGPLPDGLVGDVRAVPGVADAVVLDGRHRPGGRGVGELQLVAAA